MGSEAAPHKVRLLLLPTAPSTASARPQSTQLREGREKSSGPSSPSQQPLSALGPTAEAAPVNRPRQPSAEPSLGGAHGAFRPSHWLARLYHRNQTTGFRLVAEMSSWMGITLTKPRAVVSHLRPADG